MAHRAAVVATADTAAARRFLTSARHRLLAVVVLDRRGLVSLAQRQADPAALLVLLQEVATTAPTALRDERQRLQRPVADALPGLRTFATQLERVQQDGQGVLPHAQQTLLARAWQRRRDLGVTSAQLLQWLPAACAQAAQALLHAWETAVRVSRAVERWHRILRGRPPHPDTGRARPPGGLAQSSCLPAWGPSGDDPTPPQRHGGCAHRLARRAGLSGQATRAHASATPYRHAARRAGLGCLTNTVRQP